MDRKVILSNFHESLLFVLRCDKKVKKILSHISRHVFQVFLLLVKRLASLHYNHSELVPQDNHLKSLASPLNDGNFQTISNCRAERDGDTNRRSKTVDADYDEVDFQPTSDCNYTERINDTINNLSRTQKNMGSNVSTAGGKGLSGRRTQSSSEFPFLCFLLCIVNKIPFDLFWSHELWDSKWIFDAISNLKVVGLWRSDVRFAWISIDLHEVSPHSRRYKNIAHHKTERFLWQPKSRETIKSVIIVTQLFSSTLLTLYSSYFKLRFFSL